MPVCLQLLAIRKLQKTYNEWKPTGEPPACPFRCPDRARRHALDHETAIDDRDLAAATAAVLAGESTPAASPWGMMVGRRRGLTFDGTEVVLTYGRDGLTLTTPAGAYPSTDPETSSDRPLRVALYARISSRSVSPRPENRPHATLILPELSLAPDHMVRVTGMGWCSRQAAAGRPRRESGSPRDQWCDSFAPPCQPLEQASPLPESRHRR